MTNEHRSFAAPEDVSDVDYARDLGNPGEFPFTRGQPVRRTRTEWPHRELSGEGDATRSNAQLRYLIEHGAGGLDVIGDAPSAGLMDPDHPFARHAVGTQGVSVCRYQDYVDLYDGIPIESVSLSHSLSPSYTVAALNLLAEDRGLDPAVLRGSTITAPFYTEDYCYATLMPVEARTRLALDTIEFATAKMPKFHAFVEDTYYVSDGGVGPVEEMALGFYEIREMVRGLLARGMDIDSFGPRIAILVNCRMDLLEEIAKIRATRRIFARMMRDEFGAKDPRSWAANITVHTSGASLTAQQPINNVIRGAMQALAMAMAGVKVMEISAFDEAYRTPSAEAHMVGLRTQQILALETDVTGVADPLGGSYYIEQLTNDIERKILDRVAEIEAEGPAVDLFDRGYFREILARAMAERGAAIADGALPVVGVNCHTIPDAEDRMLREYTDTKFEPYLDHIETIKAWKAGRDQAAVSAALDAITTAMRDPAENLIPYIMRAFRADVTVGEMTGAIRVACGVAADPFLAKGSRHAA